MKTKTRTPLGKEISNTRHQFDRCPSCSVEPGELHQPGCSEEECPCCHKILIGCECNCLSPLDSTIIIQALYKRFNSMECALQAAEFSPEKSKGKVSFLVHAAMQYLFEHIDQKAKEQVGRLMQNSFPILIPSMYDEDGIGYFTPEQLAQAFDVSEQEINSRLEALAAAGFVIKNQDPADLSKRQ